ncbi:MAG: hypothetical protein C0625_01865 [Arcobacter sp.]|nr:MAG: hypothetical protein C0625_01865 [Arcobacter sp.]
MTYEELIKELCDVIKESEINSISIYENLEIIDQEIDTFDLPSHKLKKIQDLIFDSYGMLQHQDLHRQKIERVVNHVCERNNIDATQYNIAPSAKNISNNESGDLVSDDELEALIKSMGNAN